MAASSTMSSSMATSTVAVPGGEGGSSGGTGSTGSNGGSGVDGAAASIASSPTSTSSSALAGARATGDARLWAAGVGVGLVGVVGGLI